MMLDTTRADMPQAVLEAVACGEYKSVEEAAKKLVRVVETIEPEAELAEKYEDRYRRSQKIYPICKPVFEVIKEES